MARCYLRILCIAFPLIFFLLPNYYSVIYLALGNICSYPIRHIILHQLVAHAVPQQLKGTGTYIVNCIGFSHRINQYPIANLLLICCIPSYIFTFWPLPNIRDIGAAAKKRT